MAGQDTIEELEGLLASLGNGQVYTASAGAGALALPPLFAPAGGTAGEDLTPAYSAAVITLTGTQTSILLPAGPGAGRMGIFRLALIQGGSGAYTVTAWYSYGTTAAKWVGGSAPSLTTAVGSIDMVDFTCLDGTNWYGSAKLHIA
jgi:hypothetical protein